MAYFENSAMLKRKKRREIKEEMSEWVKRKKKRERWKKKRKIYKQERRLVYESSLDEEIEIIL